MGAEIFDLSLKFHDNEISLELATHEIPPKSNEISIESCKKEVLCTCNTMRIKEKA